MLHKLKILLVIVFSITLFSCSDSVLNNPDEVQSEDISFTKPSANFEKFNSPTKISRTINGKTGGVINLTGLYIGLDLRIISVNATLTIPPGAFKGIQVITLTADYQTPGLICEPAMEFNIPLTLDMVYTGLDLGSLLFTPENVVFAYLGDDGTVEPCKYDGIDFNLLRGLLGVRKAKIEHFSRYGYSR